MSLPSESIGGDVYDLQGQPGVDDTPDREGPAGRGNVCLIAGRHVTSRGTKKPWKIKIISESRNTEAGIILSNIQSLFSNT